MENQYKVGDSDNRPWGQWLVIDSGPYHCCKRITVHPGQVLSLQYHHKRDEHWIIVEGQALATKGEEIVLMKQNESLFIPKLVKHRLENPGKTNLVIIEIQYGEGLDENDIVRLSDQYGRV